MKKIFALILAIGCFAAMLAGCGLQDPLDNNNNTSGTEAASQVATADETVSIKDTDFNDDFDGLCSYFVKKGYIVSKPGAELEDKNVTQMDCALIGAENGKKFATSYNGKNITVELYSFNPDKLNDTAKDVIASVKADGSFSILDLTPVTAYLSDNGKYLMVYSDASIDENKTSEGNYVHRSEVIDDLKSFHAK